MTAKKTATRKRPAKRIKLSDLDAARIERRAARLTEDIAREERLLWGFAAAMGLALGDGHVEAAASADLIMTEWRKRFI